MVQRNKEQQHALRYDAEKLAAGIKDEIERINTQLVKFRTAWSIYTKNGDAARANLMAHKMEALRTVRNNLLRLRHTAAII